MRKTSREDKGSICDESILSLIVSFLNIIKLAKQLGRTDI